MADLIIGAHQLNHWWAPIMKLVGTNFTIEHGELQIKCYICIPTVFTNKK